MRRKNDCVVVSNIDSDDSEGQLALMEILAGDSEKIWETRESEIFAVYVHVKETDITNRQTGEVEGKHRTSIVDHDGVVWTTNSPGAADAALAVLDSTFGDRKFHPPVRVTISKIPTQGGGSCLRLKFNTKDLANGRRD